MSGQPYKRPPITEAVIEIRFAAPIDRTLVTKAIADLSLAYPLEQTVSNFGLLIGMPQGLYEQPTTQMHINQELGYKRSSSDLSEVVLLWPAAFVVAQLAPYPGWDNFFERFQKNWETFKKVTGYMKIMRLGVRFVNRIDIPFKDGILYESDYLHVYPKVPESLGNFLGYGVQAQLILSDIGCVININSASVPSPLLDHASLLLDLDIVRDADVPQNEIAVYELLNNIRKKKNEVFEACLTNRAKELFQT